MREDITGGAFVLDAESQLQRTMKIRMYTSTALQQCNHMDFDGSPLADGIHLFVGLALDVHGRGVGSEEPCQIGPNRLLVRAQLGALADHCAVDIADSVAARRHSPDRFLEELAGLRLMPAGIGIGKQLSDVRLPKGSKQGISDRMQQGIPI